MAKGAKTGKAKGKSKGYLPSSKVGKATGKPQTGLGKTAPKPTTAPAPAAPAPAPGPPAAPKLVDPFFTPDDLLAINDFTTSYLTNIGNIDFGLEQQRIDTTYQEDRTNKSAKEAQTESADQMAARGLFRSSINDAARYDIEAQRMLSNKFLEDKLTSAVLNAGTAKKVLGDSKVRFDDAMRNRMVANAQGVNDPLNAAWAEAMAAYTAAHPAPAPAAAPAAPKPAAPKPVASTPQVGAGTATPSTTKPNVASGSGALATGPKIGTVTGKAKKRLGSVA